MLTTYVKKEDAVKVLKGQKLQISIITLSMALVIASMNYFVMPKLSSLYSDFGTATPTATTLFTTYSPVLITIMILFAIYIQSNNFLDVWFEEQLAKYKADENIEISKLIRKDVQAVTMVMLGLIVGLLVMAVITPIYNITNSF